MRGNQLNLIIGVISNNHPGNNLVAAPLNNGVGVLRGPGPSLCRGVPLLSLLAANRRARGYADFANRETNVTRFFC